MSTRRRLLAALAVAAVAWAVTDLEDDARAQPGAAVEAERPFGEPIRFRHLGLDDGLPHPDVHAIHQDSLGFLWFGTEDGLARYDGAELRVYRPIPFDTTSLGGAWPLAIADAPGGSLYIVDEDGTFVRYDPRRDAFHPIATDRAIESGFGMTVARDGDVWISGRTSGLYRYDPTQETVEAFRPDNSTFPSLFPSDVIEVEDRLWIGTRGDGLVLRQPDGTYVSYRHRPGNAASLPHDLVGALLLDRRGRLWVGTGAGLALHEGDGRFRDIPALRGEDVWSLLEDPAGHLWVGTADALFRYDPVTERTARYAHDPTDASSLSAGEVRKLFLDRSGTVWIATESGLSTFEWAAPPFVHVAAGPDGVGDPGVWSFLEARDGTLWVGTEGGLDAFEPDGAVRRFQSDGTVGSIGPGWVVAIYEEPSGTLLVGTRGTMGDDGVLVRLDPATGRVVRRFEFEPGGLPADNPWAIRPDRQGRLWVLSGGSGCPSILDRATDTFEAHCLGNDDQNATKAFVEDEAGGLWMGTWGAGLVYYHPERGTERNFPHDPSDPNTPPSDVILDVTEGEDGTMWLATYGAGFSHFDPATGTFRHHHTGNSALPNDIVYALEVDEAGDVWLSTNAGLTRFSPGTEAFETFGVEDGLQDLEFNAVVSLHTSDGEMFFGGINGFNRFRPSEVGSSSRPLPVVVTDIDIEGADAAIGSDLEVAAPYAESVRLGPRARDVSFRIAAPGAPAATRYRVRLDGYDDEWHPPGPERTTAYTNLAPGRYTFRAQASAGAVWDGPEVALAVTVAPRWFEAWWFRLLAGLA
ncbi:ligand-binding sensor domain-containing protein, partial [Rubrivirga sp.]|uniref:ligand-binding sensor domain-containing protein n=1 Tax=Rubrivirga sp. TaxID=1885344 RepID=UPI003C754A7E